MATPAKSTPAKLSATPGEWRLRLTDIELVPVAAFMTFPEVAAACLAGHEVLDLLSMQKDQVSERKLIVPVVEVKLETASILKRVSTKHVEVLRVWSRLAFDEVKTILAEEGTGAFCALEKVSFKGVRVYGDDAKILAPLFAGSNKFTLANFEKNFMDDGVILGFEKTGTLKEATFTTLNLRFNQLRDASAVSLGALLGAPQPHPTIEVLNLKANRVADAGAMKLAEALRTNTKLRNMNLRRQFPGLTDVTAKAFAYALDENSSLRKLRLRRNKVQDAGAIALAESVARRFQRLQGTVEAEELCFELDLEENKVGVKGGLALVQMLREVGPEAKMEVLLFGNSGISRDGLRQALVENGGNPHDVDDPRLQIEVSKADHLL